MCLIVDINCIHSVFDPKSLDHKEFEPVKSWITSGNGKMVYGGTKFLNELSELKKFIPILARLSEAGKTVKIPTELVDNEQSIIENLVPRDCDDPHLIAIVRASKCKLICTKDARSDKYLKNIELYPKGFSRPKIYRTSKHKSLLSDENCAACCK